MLFNDGKELLFKIEMAPNSQEGFSDEIYLKHIETDEIGLKMYGSLPDYWEIVNDKLVGPELYDDDYKYQVVKVDYDNSLIWLVQL